MYPQEDPEQRIRNLERPLADAAHASELGQAPPPDGYAYAPGPTGPPVPPPPSPWAYGPGYSGPPPKPPSNNRIWWILGTVIVLGFLALAGGIAAFVVHRLSSVSSTTAPSISATFGPSTTRPRSTVPSTTRSRTPTPTASAPSTSTSPTPPPGGSLSISGIGENRTIACNDNVVTISGLSNTVVITGHCNSLTVSGIQNTITVDAVDSIDASGFNNKVTYHTGKPKVSNLGGSNVVQQG
ncbi:MAG TPA: DUF3060 domain-containing protein [Mycobacterium sp.]|nr:DUF3060 domain-containing protein [Mycobacterium sp.]